MAAIKQIFFSYSNIEPDTVLYDKINKHFSSYVRNKVISIVDRKEIFRQNADENIAFELLKKSDIAVPLLSSDFLNSDECLKLLGTAISENKLIIPVLLREIDIDSDEELRKIKKNLLPVDGRSILQHFNSTQDPDEILTAITRKIKSLALSELAEVKIAATSRLYYYILAALVVGMGVCATIFTYAKLRDVTVSCFVFLMFVCVALFALKNVLFPTTLKKI